MDRATGGNWAGLQGGQLGRATGGSAGQGYRGQLGGQGYREASWAGLQGLAGQDYKG